MFCKVENIRLPDILDNMCGSVNVQTCHKTEQKNVHSVHNGQLEGKANLGNRQNGDCCNDKTWTKIVQKEDKLTGMSGVRIVGDTESLDDMLLVFALLDPAPGSAASAHLLPELRPQHAHHDDGRRLFAPRLERD